MIIGKTVSEIKVGDTAEASRTIRDIDIAFYTMLSGDLNPLHTNDEYVKKTVFKRRLAYGAISTALVYGIFGTKLPGHGTLAREVCSQFNVPVFIGDTITARVNVTEVNVEENRVHFSFYCFNQDGVMVVNGTAVMIPPPAKLRSRA